MNAGRCTSFYDLHLIVWETEPMKVVISVAGFYVAHSERRFASSILAQ